MDEKEKIRGWSNYIEQTLNKPPSDLLINAIKEAPDKKLALDMGPGAFNDTKYLLKSGFEKVIAVDITEEGLHLAKDLPSEKFEFVNSYFEKFDFDKYKFDLINAQLSLPFNQPATFNAMFEKLKNSLKPEGVFTGQFFGIKDTWNDGKSSLTYHTLTDILNLLVGMEIIELNENEKDAKDAHGNLKHWHMYHVIARKLESKPIKE